MNKSQIIRQLLEQGKTAQETQQAVQGVSMSYIYKIRSRHRKVTAIESKTPLQQEIDRLHKLNLSAAIIASKAHCSRQYVHKQLKKRRFKSRLLPFVGKYKEQDEYYTPLYAVIPIEKHLRPCSIIWCPFDTEESIYVRHFRQQGHTVYATHITNGQDFFETEPPECCQYIVSNPPYSLKTKVFEKLNELNIPYAMLVNATGIFGAKARFEALKGVEMLVFQTRVGFMKSYDDVTIAAYPPFDSCYICKGVLPERIVFEEIDKQLITLQ